MMDTGSIQKIIEDAVAECFRNDCSFGAYGSVIAKKLGEHLASTVPGPIDPVTRVEDGIRYSQNYVTGWNNCRTAMLAKIKETK